jgi:hypothetical protein
MRLSHSICSLYLASLSILCACDASDAEDMLADAEASESADADLPDAREDDPAPDAAASDASLDAASGRDAAVALDAGPASDASGSDASGSDAGRSGDASTARDASRSDSAVRDAGPSPDASGADLGPSSCLPRFKDACTPMIVFSNEEPGGRGAIFAQVIPDPVATMQDAICTVCSILFRDPAEIPQKSRHKSVTLTLRDNPNVADASGSTIRIDLKHIAGYTDRAKALREFRGVMVHEGTHLYQNYGNNGLGEGMADFVRIRAGLYEPGRRAKGGAWTDPYTTSGFFFSWLAGPGIYHKDGREPHDVDIGYKINKTIGADGPDAVPALLRQTFGAEVDALWREYQTAIK